MRRRRDRGDDTGRLTLAPGQLAVPNVTLTRKIAEGGMGSVWEGNHLALHTTVAVKFVLAELGENEEAVARFEREATAAARIKSPHVVQVLDHGLTDNDGVPYIVMELLEGEDLEARLDREPRLPLDLVAHLIGQAAKALTKAHSLGIVHRDIKPSNVFLTDVGGDTFVKLLDFGIARLSLADVGRARVTQTGAMLGTPVFMSPEQMTHAKDVGPGADLWSLGVVAYLALTGRLPFDEETIAGIAMAIERGVFPAATSLVPELPPTIDKWFTKIFKKDPQSRFSTAREMADALGRIADVPLSPASVAHHNSTPPPAVEEASREETPSDDLQVAVEDEPTHVEDKARIEEILEEAVRDAASANRRMDSMSEIADTTVRPLSPASKSQGAPVKRPAPTIANTAVRPLSPSPKSSPAKPPVPTKPRAVLPSAVVPSASAPSVPAFADDKTTTDDRVTTHGSASDRPKAASSSSAPSPAAAKTAGPVENDAGLAKSPTSQAPPALGPTSKGPTTFMGLSEAKAEAIPEKRASRSFVYAVVALGLLAAGGAAYGVLYMNGGGAKIGASDPASAEPALAPTEAPSASATATASANTAISSEPPATSAVPSSQAPSGSAPKPPSPNRLPTTVHTATPATSGGTAPTTPIGQPTATPAGPKPAVDGGAPKAPSGGAPAPKAPDAPKPAASSGH